MKPKVAILGLVLAALSVVLIEPAAAQPGLTLVRVWGGVGGGPGQFRGPSGVALDAAGEVYVTDSFNSRVQVFTHDGVYLSQFGNAGPGAGQFNEPYGIAVDPDGFVYVVDRGNRRIQKFSSTGTFVATWNGADSPQGPLVDPLGIAVELDGNLLVTDYGLNRVLRFTPDGHYRATFLVPLPFFVAVNASGVPITPGTTPDEFLVSSGPSAKAFANSGLALCCSITVTNTVAGVAIDALGNVYLDEPSTNHVYAWIRGDLLSFGSVGSAPGQFNGPAGLAVDSSGLVFVCDSGNARIQVLKVEEHPVPAANATWGRVKDRYRQ